MAITYTPEQKHLIVDTPAGKDLLIVAGAGSGKTFTMTQRILRLLREGKDGEGRPIDPGSILGLTFTNKAAGELDRRVRTALQTLRTNGKENPHESTRDLAARPTISTYDAFFQQIVREYGLLIGIDPQTQPLTPGGLTQLASRVVSQKIDDILTTFRRPDPLLPGITPEIGSFSKIVSQIISLSSQILSYMIDEHRLTFTQALADAKKWNTAFLQTCGKGLESLQKKADRDAQAIATTYPQALATYLDNPGAAEKVPVYKSKRGAATRTRKLYVRQVGRLASLYLTARRRAVILDLAGDFQDLKQSEGMADFADFTAYALRLVCRFPSIGARYRRRYRSVFLDEYQDTSTTQAKLIAQLFHPATAQDAKGGPGRSVVTAVGDPFQSIYGWRGASPSAFSLFKQDFTLSGNPATLSMTHRNKMLVLGLANRLTQPLRNPSLLGRPSGEDDSEKSARIPVKPLQPWHVHGEDLEEKNPATVTAVGFTLPDQEQQAIAGWAKAEVRKLAPLRKQGEERQPLVAVLLRSKTHMDDYVSALEDEGLDVQVVGLDRVLDQPEVRDLMAVLTCVSDHTAVPSLMRLLATPRYGLTSTDLQALAGAARTLNEQKQYASLVAAGLATGSEDEAQRAALLRAHRDSLPVLSTLIDLLLEGPNVPEGLLDPLTPEARNAVSSLSAVLRATEAAQSQGLTATVDAARDALGLDTDVALSQVVTHPREAPLPLASARANTGAVAALVDTYLSELLDTSSATLRGFVAWVHGQNADLSPISPAALEADVVVMTIHQAKGLEWPAVAIAGMTSRNFPSRNAVLIDTKTGSLRAVAHTWAEDPGSVPDPVRSDAAILPPFPHTLRPGDDPVKAIENVRDPTRLGGEVFAPSASELADGTRGENYPAWLSLQERYGRREHAEERRLAYVAVTRSSGDVLLTFAGRNRNTLSVDEKQAGIFWQEARDYLQEGAPDACGQSVSVHTIVSSDQAGRPTCAGEGQMVGVSRGPEARETLRLFDKSVPVRSKQDVQESQDPLLGQLLWPARVPRKELRVLAQSADMVTAAIRKDAQQASASKKNDQSAPTPLTDRARQLLAIARQQHSSAAGTQPAQDLTARARAALRGRSVPTTTLQRLASTGQHGQPGQPGADTSSLLLQIVRPMPAPPNEAANLGTLFHNWVATLLDPASEEPLEAGIPDPGDVQTQLAALGDSREARRLARWQKAFQNSIWARRRVVAVERPYDMALAGHRIPARLDAVFAGALADRPGEEQTGRYTIVDWKTGRPPTTAVQREERLLQLDLYRIAFSRARTIPIGRVDACLFYVSAPAGRRQIPLTTRHTERQIIANILANPAAAAVLGTDFDEDDTSQAGA